MEHASRARTRCRSSTAGCPTWHRRRTGCVRAVRRPCARSPRRGSPWRTRELPGPSACPWCCCSCRRCPRSARRRSVRTRSARSRRPRRPVPRPAEPSSSRQPRRRRACCSAEILVEVHARSEVDGPVIASRLGVVEAVRRGQHERAGHDRPRAARLLPVGLDELDLAHRGCERRGPALPAQRTGGRAGATVGADAHHGSASADAAPVSQAAPRAAAVRPVDDAATPADGAAPPTTPLT